MNERNYREVDWQVTVKLTVPKEWDARGVANVVERAIKNDTYWIGVGVAVAERDEA